MLLIATRCGASEPEVVEVQVEKVVEVVKEVPVEVEVVKEVQVERVVEVVKEVPLEVVKEVPVEVVKEVPVEKVVEVEVEVVREVPVEVEVVKEVVKEVPVEKVVTKEVVKEVVVTKRSRQGATPFELRWAASASGVSGGDSFILTVRMYGVREAGERGGVSVSFPSLSAAGGSDSGYSSYQAVVEAVEYTSGLSNVTFYQPGSAIYHSDGTGQFPASSPSG